MTKMTPKNRKSLPVRGSIFEGPKSTYFWPFFEIPYHLQGPKNGPKKGIEKTALLRQVDLTCLSSAVFSTLQKGSKLANPKNGPFLDHF